MNNRMNMLFIGGIFPKEYKKEIELNSKHNVQYAANNLQWSLIRGLSHYIELEIVNLIFVGSFPHHYRKILIPSFSFRISNEEKLNKNIGFVNLPVFKNISRFFNLYQYLRKNVCTNDKTTIIVYSLHSPFLLALYLIKKKNPNIYVCSIIPDLPRYMSFSKNIIYLIFKFIDLKIIKFSLKGIDSYVPLTKGMVSFLDYRKPYTVIEGIYNNQDDHLLKINSYKNIEKKIILYSGTLDRRYGIKLLLEAFHKIECQEYELHIYGDGEYRENVKYASYKDTRIKYFGIVPTELIRKKQREATVLVNPRTSDGKFTEYSFPSKNIEYMSAGRPVILFKLKGIPSEYYEYCYAIEKETDDELCSKIFEVCSMDESERSKFGEKARDFIVNNKNPEKQCLKILNMIENSRKNIKL